MCGVSDKDGTALGDCQTNPYRRHASLSCDEHLLHAHACCDRASTLHSTRTATPAASQYVREKLFGSFATMRHSRACVMTHACHLCALPSCAAAHCGVVQRWALLQGYGCACNTDAQYLEPRRSVTIGQIGINHNYKIRTRREARMIARLCACLNRV